MAERSSTFEKKKYKIIKIILKSSIFEENNRQKLQYYEKILTLNLCLPFNLEDTAL